VVEAAGGRVTDLDGRALDFSRGTRLEGNRGVLVSNGRIHGLILETLAAVGG
jgi:3'(2'), 5'-bisphosphate nucleotidase